MFSVYKFVRKSFNIHEYVPWYLGWFFGYSLLVRARARVCVLELKLFITITYSGGAELTHTHIHTQTTYIYAKRNGWEQVKDPGWRDFSISMHISHVMLDFHANELVHNIH